MNENSKEIAANSDYRIFSQENRGQILADLNQNDSGQEITFFQDTDIIIHYVIEEQPNQSIDDHDLAEINAGVAASSPQFDYSRYSATQIANAKQRQAQDSARANAAGHYNGGPDVPLIYYLVF